MLIPLQTLQKMENETRVYPYGELICPCNRTYNSRCEQDWNPSEGYTMLTSSINPLKGMLNELQGKKNPGDNVVTTLNLETLQGRHRNELGSKRGAVVAMDPETGKILVMREPAIL